MQDSRTFGIVEEGAELAQGPLEHEPVRLPGFIGEVVRRRELEVVTGLGLAAELAIDECQKRPPPRNLRVLFGCFPGDDLGLLEPPPLQTKVPHLNWELLDRDRL